MCGNDASRQKLKILPKFRFLSDFGGTGFKIGANVFPFSLMAHVAPRQRDPRGRPMCYPPTLVTAPSFPRVPNVSTFRLYSSAIFLTAALKTLCVYSLCVYSKMDSDQEQSHSRKKSVKLRREKLGSVHQKYSRVRLAPSKFQAICDDLSDTESADSDSDLDSEFIETETADDDETESEGSEDYDVYIAIRARRGMGTRTAGTTRTPPTSSDEAWSTDNTPPFVDSYIGVPGLTCPVPSTPLGFVQLFLTQSLLKYMVYETNLYATQSNAPTLTNTSNRWEPVSVKDMARFLGLTILMGILRLPRIRMYWQTGKFWHVPCFNTFMTSKRYELISKYFHIYNSNAIAKDNPDRLIKVRTVMQYLTQKFKTLYIPQKNMRLDEGTMAWRGRLAFKTYNPNKPDKYGIKLYMLAESQTGYIYDFEVYAGSGKTTIETVMGLIEPLKNKGYHLYMDNYYNSVRLSELLLEQGVYTCGTIRLQRGQRGGPKSLQVQAKGKMPVDKTVFRRKDNTFIILWKDKRVVSLITTCHNADTQQVERRKRVRKPDGTFSLQQVTVNKPNAICDYNTHMKGVDHFDQMVKYYQFTRKSYKWTKKMTFYFLQMAIHNAFVLYNYYTTDTKKLTLLHFHEVVISSLLYFQPKNWPLQNDNITHAADVHDNESTSTGHNVATPGPSGVRRPPFPSPPVAHSSSDSEDKSQNIPSGASARKKTRIMDNPERLNRNLCHSLVKIQKRLRCRVCKMSSKRRDTRYKCKSCNVPLCAAPCYSKYHRKKQFWADKQ
ncbi:piggyBac transposable element-derived protein 4-like [Procambarus clarkii]|uniref:piggyBac transposable element-derived protein 4-like n=1 Tax=Procambarus clarkii TaxID=6728 RepID=UPI003742B843